MKSNRLLILLFLMAVATPIAASPFTDNGDGTVSDGATNLMWQMCSVGQTYSGGTCTGSALQKTWQEALQACSGPGGSWRLPSINELKSIVDRGNGSPYIDSDFFPGTAAGYYWSSTSFLSGAFAFYIDFSTGNIRRDSSKTGTLYARCVSGP